MLTVRMMYAAPYGPLPGAAPGGPEHLRASCRVTSSARAASSVG
ncbi:hypothetical protein STAFG_2765 [Streptomyces afghaniensis 772]|uniref:Uncharacterized protein n=1 Tax=Streptomyces afghaniensis 772 TaxID=1283301 RepID=S4MKU4_9ACTN|nr:hypothetical protein STAFG_2765 [Streptomyces afghaniensis 772]